MEDPNTNSLLLNSLPPELIKEISGFLPPIDRAIFSLTCRSARRILGNSDVHRLSVARYLRYLVRVARDLPDQWVCEACFTLHPISQDDTPLSSWKMTCPLRWDRWCHEVYGQPFRLDSRYVSVDHRHVQLALKYTRLQDPRYQLYLNKLLAEHHDTKFPTHPYPYNRQNVLKVKYVATPRVVWDPHGNMRYMLRSFWDFRKDSMEVSLVTVGDIKICPHLALLGDMRHMTVHEVGTLQLIKQDIILNGRDAYPASCQLCATDLHVRIHEEGTIVHAWQDMGTKGSPGDKAWRLHVSDPRFGMVPPGGRNPIFKHPGSIKELYNRAYRPPKHKTSLHKSRR